MLRVVVFRDIFIDEYIWKMYKCLVGKYGVKEESYKGKKNILFSKWG